MGFTLMFDLFLHVQVELKTIIRVKTKSYILRKIKKTKFE